MRILYLTPTDIFSGGENVTLQIAKNMQTRGHTVAYCGLFGPIEKTVEKANVKFIGIPRFSLKEIRTVLRNFKPDIVHAMDYRASFYTALLNQRFVGHLHSNCPWLKKLCANSLALLYTARKAEKLICVSESIAHDFVFSRKTEQKFLTLPNCIDAQEIIYKSQEFLCTAAYDMGYCGRLSKPKNPLAFVEIVRYVKQDIPDIKAVMIGDGELREQVQNKIAEYHLQENIEMLGFQENPFPYIAACKVMVMPSLWEGFPMVAIEAMALGKPLFATPVSGVRDIITDQCGGIKETQDLLARAVGQCLQQPEKEYHKMAQNARAAAAPYADIERYMDMVEKIIGVG